MELKEHDCPVEELGSLAGTPVGNTAGFAVEAGGAALDTLWWAQDAAYNRLVNTHYALTARSSPYRYDKLYRRASDGVKP